MAVQKYGLDLGTGTIKIYKEGLGLALKEKNMIAIRRKTEMVAFGDEAYAMYERSPLNIKVYCPVKNGMIAELHDMQILLDLFLKKIKCTNGFVSSNVFYFAVPSDITEVEKRAFFDLAMGSEFKTKDLYIVEKPVATAVGEKIDVLHTPGAMVIDFGQDTVEISVVALGGLVASRLLKIGGNAMDEAVCEAVKEQNRLLIGMKTAESLKLELGSALNAVQSYKKVLGRDMITGLPAEARVDSQVVCEPIQSLLHQSVRVIKTLFERTPPEVLRSIRNNGIIVNGEGSRLTNLKEYLERELSIPVVMSEKPDESVIRGLAKIMADDKMRSLAFSVKEAIFS
ncbi:MAG: rod shape-determining protein [Clostridia bacterium]|nr:rod shape-determining protein [Lachnospiraceae bacterium]NCC00651.1 rod shape-determining protein [Clostridia bacterium]NCD02663.1 rod shape-determining protein [Clostridia bacterium]